jgi:putative redox protein
MAKIQILYEGSLRTRCIHEESGSEIETDAPKDNFGKGEKFSPTDLVAVALGSCVLTLIGIAANKLKVDLTGLRLTAMKQMAVQPSRRIGKIVIDVYCPGQFPPEIQQKFEVAAKTCPVHHSLHPEIVQELTFHWGAP